MAGFTPNTEMPAQGLVPGMEATPQGPIALNQAEVVNAPVPEQYPITPVVPGVEPVLTQPQVPADIDAYLQNNAKKLDSEVNQDLFANQINQPIEQEAVQTPQTTVPQGPDLESLLKSQVEAATKVGDAQAAIERAKGAAAEKTALALDSQMRDLENTKTDVDERVSEKEQVLDDELNQYREFIKTRGQLPTDIWATKSTGQKAAAGIAIVLGAIGSGLAKDPVNRGLEAVNNAINKDLQTLKDNINTENEARLKVMGITQDQVRQARQKFETDLAYFDKLKLVQLSAIEARLAQAAAPHNSTIVQNNAKNAIAQLQIQQMQLRQQIGQKHSIQALIDSAPDGDVRKLPAQIKARLAQDPIGKDLLEQAYKDAPLMVPGYGMAQSEQAATAARKIVSAGKNMEFLVKSIKQEVENSSRLGRAIPGEVRSRLQNLYAQVQGEYKESQALGALDKGVENLVNMFLKNPTSLINFTNYDQVLKTANVNIDNKLKPLGISNYLTQKKQFQTIKPAR